MSVLVTKRTQAVLWDDTTGMAFGPVFEYAADAEDFLDFCKDLGVPDIRTVSEDDVMRMYSEFLDRNAKLAADNTPPDDEKDQPSDDPRMAKIMRQRDVIDALIDLGDEESTKFAHSLDPNGVSLIEMTLLHNEFDLRVFAWFKVRGSLEPRHAQIDLPLHVANELIFETEVAPV